MEKNKTNTKMLCFRFLARYAIWVLTLLLILVVSCMQQSFLTLANWKNIMNQVAVSGIAACAMSFVLMIGCVDLSIGSVISVCCITAAMLVNSGNGMLAVFVPSLVGILLGTLTGILAAATHGRMGESFMVTYGMQLLLAAVAMIISHGMYIAFNSYTGTFVKLGSGTFAFYIFAVVILICQFVLKKTPYGRNMLFMGANPKAAALSGIRTELYTASVFAICGFISGIAATVLTSRVMCAQPAAGSGYEMDAIAACVVGGISMNGGRGSFASTLAGVLIIGVLSNALNLLSITTNPQFIVKGCIIILAVSLDLVYQRLQKV